MSATPALRLVNPETGEITESGCPHCADKDRQLEELNRKFMGTLSQLGKLRADKEAEALKHELWPKAVELFDWWRLHSDHPRARWTPDRFWIVEPFLRREGFKETKIALIGLLFYSDYHMKRGEYAKRKGPRYDEFERPFESQKNYERFRDLVPRPSEETREFFAWYDPWRESVDKLLRKAVPA